jgi:hypothetical protein
MTYRFWLSLGLTLMVVSGSWTAAGAEGYIPGGESMVTVDALPLQAEVRLDGVIVGTAYDLLNRPLAVLPGDHLVQVSARGYLTTAVAVPSIPNWASRVQVVLIPDRGR